jgi:EmrB/QacA subfamily drug resistance transporter
LERKWWTLIAVSVAIFMLLLDITVVNVALPDIQRSLHSSFSDLQWVVNAYALTLAALLLTSGAVSDLVGRKRVFLAGLVVFSVASAVCGLSTTPLMLNLARAVQGTGGAMMFATSLALLAGAFHGKERGTAFGVFGAVTGAAVAVGPVLGGIITSGIGWKWIFFVNVPIGAVAVFVTVTQVEDSRDPGATGVDWAGLITFSGSLFMLVYALVQGNQKGWGSTEIVALLVGSAALLIAFLAAETVQRRPMLDLALFRRPAFAGANIVAFTLSSSFFAMFLYLTLYIQDVLGYSPVQAGLRFLPTTLLSFAVAPIAGKLSVRMPVRILLGSGLLLIGIGLLAMTTISASSHWTVLIPAFVLAGAGVGLVNPPLASTAIGVVPHERSGMASGINSTFRQVGIATGIAGLGAIFQHSVSHGTTAVLRASGQLHAVTSAAHGQLGTLLESGEVTQIARTLSPAARGALLHSYRVGFTGAFTTIAIVAAVIALSGAVLAFALVRGRDFVSSAGGHAPPSAPAPAPVGERPAVPAS